MTNSQIKILAKKYLKISLKTRIKIYHECENKAYTTTKTLEHSHSFDTPEKRLLYWTIAYYETVMDTFNYF